jgi:hypothetical protein
VEELFLVVVIGLMMMMTTNYTALRIDCRPSPSIGKLKLEILFKSYRNGYRD